MNTVEKKSLITIPVPAKGFTIILSNRGNPDFGGNPKRQVPGVPELRMPADSLVEASQLVRTYIEDNDLGSGNWVGDAGNVISNDTTKVVAKISYNGRAWLPGPWPQPEISLI